MKITSYAPVQCPACGIWHPNEFPHKRLLNYCGYCIDKTVELQWDRNRVCKTCSNVLVNCSCEVTR